MNIFFIVTIIIFYFLLDILTLNNEVTLRVKNYKNNSKNIKRKPLCDKRRTVFLFVIVGVLIAIITAISNVTAILAFIMMWIIDKIIRRKRLKEIKYLDKENEEYWKG
ncbi:MAG: hypothetical protein UHK60_03635 [Acutalibacteraceae bacterium]|nr:hypothetical protein [Acutalibacteraceae bacterium]